jgi:hypothetical protein
MKFRSLLAGLVMTAIAAPAMAGKPYYNCKLAPNFAKEIYEQNGERALMTWDEKDGTERVFFLNPETKTWTLAAIEGDGQTCTWRTGTGFTFDPEFMADLVGDPA